MKRKPLQHLLSFSLSLLLALPLLLLPTPAWTWQPGAQSPAVAPSSSGMPDGARTLERAGLSRARAFPWGVTVGGDTGYVIDGSGAVGDASASLTQTAAPYPIHIRNQTADSYASALLAVGELVYFAGNDGITGTELWMSNGTEAGTVLVRDINPGAAGSSPLHLARKGTEVYFRADDGVHGAELWKSDGTEAGTVMVKDINPAGSAAPSYMTLSGETLFFSAYEPEHGQELWRTDGTEAGTVMVRDLYPGTGDATPYALVDVNGKLFFLAGDGVHSNPLWKTDGTEAGTRFVANLWPNPGLFTPVNGRLFFRTWDSVGYFYENMRLMVTDGTEAGTLELRNYDDDYIDQFTSRDDALFFYNQWTGDIIRSDGTVTGTIPAVTSLDWDVTVSNLTNPNGTLFFAGQDDTQGKELWTSDGTDAGTELVKDIYPGSGSSGPSQFTGANGQVFLVAGDADHGTEIWKTDGTEAGTVLVKDISPGPRSSSPAGLAAAGSRVFFWADDGVHGRELWASDGTPEGTQLARDVNTTPVRDAAPANLADSNGVLLLSADDGLHGQELWRSDGTPGGTWMLKDIWPEGNGSAPGRPVTAGGQAFFAASDPVHGNELWKTDGTAAGTLLVTDIYSGTKHSSPSSLTAWNGRLYFFAWDADTGGTSRQGLWVSDGTEAGTAALKYFDSSLSPGGALVSGGALYFFVTRNSGGSYGGQLWRSDGTSDGTVMVEEIYTGSTSPGLTYLTDAGGTAFFCGRSGSAYDLWKSDGTAAGTAPVLSGLTSCHNLVALNGILYFIAGDSVSGEEVRRTDGTPAGTWVLKDIVAGSGTSYPHSLVNAGGVLYFAAQSRRLWKSDGTPEGTVLVDDGATNLGIERGTLTRAGGRVYYAAYDRSSGEQRLWRTNGSQAGTFMVTPGVAWPTLLTALSDTLFLSAYSAAGTRELWAVPDPTPDYDDFDRAIPLAATDNGVDGQLLDTDTRDATVAADDPDMGCGAGVNNNTVWASLTPGFTGTLRLRTFSLLDPAADSTYDTVLAVFTGARGSLQRVGCNDNAPGRLQSELYVPVEAGVTVYVEIAGQGVQPGGGILSLYYGRDLSIRGRVRDGGGAPIPGVTLSAGDGRSATTDASGSYILRDLLGGPYTLTAALPGYTFTPSSRSVAVPPDAAGQDFTGTALTSTLSGHARDESGSPLAGVTVSTGEGRSTVTDANGAYILTGLPPGTYTLTPFRSGYSFAPASRTASVPPAATGQDFVGTAVPLKLKLLVVPLRWQGSQAGFEAEARTQSDVFLEGVPLNGCRNQALVETLDVAAQDFEGFTCSASDCAVDSIRTFVRDELEIDPADYDVIVGLAETSPCPPVMGCSNGTDTIWVTAEYDSVTAHELGHIYDLEDQYCSTQAGSTDERCNDGDSQGDGAATGDVNWLDGSLPFDCPPDGSDDSGGSRCCNFGGYDCSAVDYGVCCEGNKNPAGGRSTMSYANAAGPRGFDGHDSAHLGALPELSCGAPGSAHTLATGRLLQDPSPMVLDVNLLVHANDVVDEERIAITPGRPTPGSVLQGMSGDYSLKILDVRDGTAWSQAFALHFDYSGPVVLGVDYSHIQQDVVDVSFRIPYAPEMSRLALYHGEQLIFSKQLPGWFRVHLPLVVRRP